MICVLGIDPSLTSLGVATPDGTESWQPKGLRGAERLAYFWHKLGDTLSLWTPDIVCLEGYAYSARGNSYDLGELGGILRLRLFMRSIPVVLIAPTQRAKFATGKGNASKDEVVSAVTHRSGRLFVNSDEADAWVLREMGVIHYTPQLAETCNWPLKSVDAMQAVEWPELKGLT